MAHHAMSLILGERQGSRLRRAQTFACHLVRIWRQFNIPRSHAPGKNVSWIARPRDRRAAFLNSPFYSDLRALGRERTRQNQQE